MEADINALSIIITLIFSIFWLFKHFDKPQCFLITFFINTISIFIICITFYIEIASTNSMGRPFLQWLIPLLCLWLIITFTKYARLHFCILYIMIALALTCNYKSLICNEYYYGKYVGFIKTFDNAAKDAKLNKLKLLLKSKKIKNSININENWLINSEIINYLNNDEIKLLSYSSIEITAEWHSWFSNLYRIKDILYSAWYSGGNLKDNIDKIYYKN